MKPTVFIHVPKTAGVTLKSVLYRQYPDAFSWGSRDRGLLASWESTLADLQQQLEGRPLPGLIHGHFPYGIHEVIGPVQYMTMLRNPVDRVISAYWYLRRHKVGGEWFGESLSSAKLAADEMSLEEFVERDPAGGMHNGQTCMLAGTGFGTEPDLSLALTNLVSCASVGLTERFDESLERYRQVFDWKASIEHQNYNVAEERHIVEPETRALIESYNELDLQLYAFAESTYQRGP